MAYERLNLKQNDLLDEEVFKRIDDGIENLDVVIETLRMIIADLNNKVEKLENGQDVSSSITITDDGNGNLTITTSLSDDNNGNVTMSSGSFNDDENSNVSTN